MLQVTGNPDIPLYRRIVEAVCDAIVADNISPGERLPAKSALADDLGISPVTVGRSYELLQGRGIVIQKRGSGTYITSDARLRLQAETSKRFSVIAMVIGESDLGLCRPEHTQVASDILAGVKDELGSIALPVMYAESFNEECLGSLPDDSAVLLLRPKKCDPAMVETLKHRGIPMAGVWWGAPSLGAAVACIGHDRQQAAALGCQHLVNCGYKRIGYIGTKGKDLVPVKFYQFTNVLHEAGLDYRAAHVRGVNNERGRVYRAAYDLIQSGDLPEALVVDADHNAIEVIHALQDAGLDVPGDIGVISYNDAPEAALLTPALTTVRTPRKEVGRRAVKMLLGQIEPPVDGVDVTLQSQLVVRESTRQISPC